MSKPVEIEIAELEEVQEGVNEDLNEKVFKELPVSVLKGIEVEVKVEVGKAKMSVQELVTLSVGGVVELNTPSTQQLNLLIGDEVVAKGNLVIVDGHYGIQVAEVFSR